MSKINDGGSAFPGLVETGTLQIGDDDTAHPVFGAQGGMSLRDWFAGQAIIACDGINPHLPGDPANSGRWPEAEELAKRQARYAYFVADAMLAERERQP